MQEEPEKKQHRPVDTINVNFPISIDLHRKLVESYREGGGRMSFGKLRDYYAYCIGEYLALSEMLNDKG